MTQTAITELQALLNKHKEAYALLGIDEQLADAISDAEYTQEVNTENLMLDGTIPLTNAEYATVWNKQEAGLV